MDDVISLKFKTFSASDAAGCSERQQVVLLLHVRGRAAATASCLCVPLSAFTVDVAHFKRGPRARDVPCVMEKGKYESREMSDLRSLWCICHCVQCTAKLFLKLLDYCSGFIHLIN